MRCSKLLSPLMALAIAVPLAAQTKRKPVAKKPEAVASQTEAVASQTEAVASQTEAVASQTEAVASQTEAVASQTEAVESQPKASSTPSLEETKDFIKRKMHEWGKTEKFEINRILGERTRTWSKDVVEVNFMEPMIVFLVFGDETTKWDGGDNPPMESKILSEREYQIDFSTIGLSMIKFEEGILSIPLSGKSYYKYRNKLGTEGWSEWKEKPNKHYANIKLNSLAEPDRLIAALKRFAELCGAKAEPF